MARDEGAGTGSILLAFILGAVSGAAAVSSSVARADKEGGSGRFMAGPLQQMRQTLSFKQRTRANTSFCTASSGHTQPDSGQCCAQFCQFSRRPGAWRL